MSDLEEKALRLRSEKKYNCCQAVIAAMTDDDPTLVLAGAGFGSGMGDTNGPCGALTGAVMVAGIRTEGKDRHQVVLRVQKIFREKSGAVICRDLKGIDTGTVLCPCDQCIRNGVQACLEVTEQ